MIKTQLTIIDTATTMPTTGETEAGSAEVQPARDNQPGVTDDRCGGPLPNARPTQPSTKTIQSSPMPKKNLIKQPRAAKPINSLKCYEFS